MSELKRCPFCGGEALLNVIPPHKHEFATFMPDYPGGAFIECSKCSCGIGEATEEKAIEVWNTRKPMDRIVERLEEQKSYADDLDDDLSCGEYTGLALAIEIVKEEGGLNET